MFINLLIVSKEIRQNIEKSTYLPACTHSLKTPLDFPEIVYGTRQELESRLKVDREEYRSAKRKLCPFEEEDLGIGREEDVWMLIYANSLNCHIQCDCRSHDYH